MQPSNGFHIINQLLEILPRSPFAPVIEEISVIPYLGYLNWFLPVRQILVAMAAWLTAVALYYGYSVIMRWVKLIGD